MDLQTMVDGVLAVPVHRSLGVRLVDAGDPAAGLLVDVEPQNLNNYGILHGGVIALLLDVAAYLAVLPVLDEGTNAVTTSAATSLIAPGQVGDTVRFTGTVDRVGRRLAHVQSAAYAGDRLLATGQLVKAVVRQDVRPSRT